MHRLASIFPLALLAIGVPSMAADAWVLTAKKIYTAPDAPPLANGVILVSDGKISAIDSNTAVLKRPDERDSECQYGVVTSGFQNSHVHFMERRFDDAAHLPAAQLERDVLAMTSRYGFTTVFDTGSDVTNTIALRQRIEKGEIRGPRILTVGIPLYPPEGIPSYIRDLPPEMLAKMHQPPNGAEARADVRANLGAGADATKLFLHTSPDQKTVRFMSLEVARAAAEETHAQGKLVLAHPTSLEGVRGALAAGVDVLVHTTLGEDKPWDAETLQKLVANHVSVIPTFKLWKYELQKENVPPAVIDRLIGATLQELRDFKNAGGQILFGTDVGYMHDYDPTDEYLYMAQAGLTPMEILASLTTAPAARWKEDSSRGRVAPKSIADLVVLEGDPAEDVRNFARVRCVYRGGKLIFSSKAAH